MEYLTVFEVAEKWGVTSRMVNYYCHAGRISGAIKKDICGLFRPTQKSQMINGIRKTKQRENKLPCYTFTTNKCDTLVFRGGASMQKILIVEDDLSIRALLHDFLQEAGYDISLAADGVEAVSVFSANTFDLVLLDIMLPKIDGYSVCEVIRKQSNVPIVMLTALDSEAEQIKGFDLQIDDYITKPFSMPVLMRKIAVVLRRTAAQDTEIEMLQYRNVKLDFPAYKAYVDGEDVDLTPREFEVLRELLAHQGRILTRENMINLLWKYDFYGDERIIDTHIKNLRKKLGVEMIETVRGVGYRVDEETKKQSDS